MQKPKGVYVHNCRFAGKRAKVKMSDFIPEELQLIIEMNQSNDQYGLQIKNVKETLLPILKKMYPEEFGADIAKYMDRVDDAVRANEKEQRSHIRSDEWFDGYEAAVEVMQQEMNLIEEKL